MSTLSETSICCMALSKIGSARITDIYSDTSVQAIQCQTHYDQTRDALLRSFEWSFAIKQAELSEDSSTPTFGYDHQFLLPADFIRVTLNWDDGAEYNYDIQGLLLLTDESEINLEYVAQITDTTTFDALFVEVLILQLALKFLHPLAGTKALDLKQGLLVELKDAMKIAKTVCRTEKKIAGRSSWNEARYGSGKFYPLDPTVIH
jgi:hypothetical protein